VKKKILAFDSWTGGVIHYARLMPELRKKHIELMLVHIGSWGSDMGRPKEESLQGILVRDVCFYDNPDFENILKTEKPDLVLFLSTQTFAHRAFIRFCKKLKIPTVHLTHGIFSSMALESGRFYKMNLLSYGKFILSRVVKMFKKVWPTYLGALLRTSGGNKDFLNFIRDNINLLLSRDAPLADDGITDQVLIYTAADLDYAISNFRSPHTNIKIVGNPDASRFGLTEELINLFSKEQFQKNKDVVYIDTSLILRGAIFQDFEQYRAHLMETNQAFRDLGRRMFVKLHPNFDGTGIPQRLRAVGLEICPHERFLEHLRNSCCALTEASTAGLMPAYMGLPVFLAQYGRLKEHQFGSIFSTYPRAVFLRDLPELKNYFCDDSELKKIFNKDISKWVDFNLGPRPLDAMPRRCVEAFVSLMKERIS